MLKKFIQLIGGDPNQRTIDRLSQIVQEINALEPEYEQLSDEALAAKTGQFRSFIKEQTHDIEDHQELFKAEQSALQEILPQAFAVVREASKRTLGMRHFDVQLIGGIVLHQGKIAEMRTGEGKTLVATLPIYLNALTGRGVHLITVNDYLARRDARWMAPIFNMLGLSVGVLQMAARTENGKKAFLVDFTRESPHEDQHHLRMTPRAEAYAADITYGTNSEFGFDYLRDNMAMRLEDRVQRGHHFAIVDEVDNVLIDEARTPLIISGPAQDDTEWYVRMNQVVRQLRPEDYEIDEKNRTVTLTETGEAHVEEILELPLRDPERPEDVTPEQARLLGYLEQALRAHHLYKRNKDYLVQSNKVIIVDEFTGRMMPGRRWSDGLHQAVEAKEGVRVQSESVTYATITIQNYFRMYQKLAGMTGTAVTESEEFHKIYKLDVVAIPTNLEYTARRPDSDLIELDGKDEQGYRYTYYAYKNSPSQAPVFWRRKDYPDVIYRSQEAKLRSICREILKYHVLGRPILVGTASVELSETLSDRLNSESLRRLAQILLLRDAWMQSHNVEEDGRLIEELNFLHRPMGLLNVNDMRRLAKELNISFTPDEPANLQRLVRILDIPEENMQRLASALQAGIPRQVLNARKHTEESQIIAGAGAFGAVTIATNMAGRGVDIKLGGELAEEIISSVNRVLKRAGYPDPYDMSMTERREAILKLDPSEYGIYEAEIQYFLKYMKEMELVRTLGGLHVIGSERHEARRIDNQLRGRAARQGDPGSSKFYLSMEDELMRLFGGQQVDSIMQRLKIDDDFPIELGMVSRLVESSQTRVEGANFDVRKHLLEYDDVVNTQRVAIYSQRDRIFTKDDLTDDILEMLQEDVSRRVPEALNDEGGPWKLLAWLDQVQPTIEFGDGVFFPSFSMQLLLDHLKEDLPENPSLVEVQQKLLRIAHEALDTEKKHYLQAARRIIDLAETRYEAQLAERIENVDIFLDGLTLGEDEDQPPRRIPQVLNELSSVARIPIRLTQEQQHTLMSSPQSLTEFIHEQVELDVKRQAIARLLGAIKRITDIELDVKSMQPNSTEWHEVAYLVLQSLESAFAERMDRYLGDDGQIARDLDRELSRFSDSLQEYHFLQLLLALPRGQRSAFNKRTHKLEKFRTVRLNLSYYAATLLQDESAKQIADDVLHHLEAAYQVLLRYWGKAEFDRLANTTLADLDPKLRDKIYEALNGSSDQLLLDKPFNSFSLELQTILIEELGRRALTNIYRQLLLEVITRLWVEYLTQMEALRVSIGLEAYGQRDPLVQYKTRASELFQGLLHDMRTDVVRNMFTYRPRTLDHIQTAASRVNNIPGNIAEIDNNESDVTDNHLNEIVKEEAASPTATIELEVTQKITPMGGKKRNRHKRR